MIICVLILPAPLRDKGNAFSEVLGWGLDNYTVPLSADGQEPAPHYGIHAWVEQTFVDMVDAGVMPPGVDYSQADFDAIMAALVSPFRTDMTGHWQDVLGAEGLQVMEVDDGL